MPIKIIIFFITLIFQTSVSYAGSVEEQVITTTGFGSSQNEAVQEALVEALGQIKGKKIDADKISKTKRKIRNNTEDISKSSYSKIKQVTQGIILNYKIIKIQKNKHNLYKAKVSSTIAIYNNKQLSRKRLAVLPFKINNDIFNDESISFINSWQKKLEEGLTQTRRFAMIDKSYEYESSKELKGYQNKQYMINEIARIGNKAGVDYMIIGTLNNLVNKTILLGDKKIKIQEISIALRIIDIATGQIKYAKTVAQPKKAVREILFAIYPIAIVAKNKNLVTLNSGGNFLKRGTIYKVVRLGKMLTDPYTKEKIGREEIDIGEIELTEINAKTSKATIIKGNDEIEQSLNNGLLIRPLTNKQKKNLVDELDNMDY